MWIDVLCSVVVLYLLIRVFGHRKNRIGQTIDSSEVNFTFNRVISFTLFGGLVWGYLKYSDLETHAQMGFSFF